MIDSARGTNSPPGWGRFDQGYAAEISATTLVLIFATENAGYKPKTSPKV